MVFKTVPCVTSMSRNAVHEKW